MKINLSHLAVLMVALLAVPVTHANHEFTGTNGAPRPVKRCFELAEQYKELLIRRAAGFSLEDSRAYDEYTIRLVRYSYELQELDFDAANADNLALVADMTNEIYALSDEYYVDLELAKEWVTEKFDTCVADIPIADQQSEEHQYDRMME